VLLFLYLSLKWGSSEIVQLIEDW